MPDSMSGLTRELLFRLFEDIPEKILKEKCPRPIVLVCSTRRRRAPCPFSSEIPGCGR